MTEINCRLCIAACCSPNIALQLTDAEKQFLEAAGTVLKQEVRPMPIDFLAYMNSTGPAGSIDFENDEALVIQAYHGLYLMLTQCGHVEKQGDFEYACGAYDQPGRPKICEKFIVGGKACQKIRLSRGVNR